ncbi:DUF3239 domain-containing protein [Corynebacterium halotolerans]|uniref:DUF3239 domain-containing protein n=1 Tax=Corynebacterium halotolerans TaxID=225326 RepID=UPI003CE825C1
MKVFKFEVDEQYAKQNNEMLRDSRRLVLSGVVFAIILLIVGLVAWFLADGAAWGWITAIVFAVMAVIFVAISLAVPKKMGGAQELYDTYPLAPAMVAEVNARDVVIMALVNTNVDPQRPPRWGLALRTINRLGGHDRKLGTQLPVAAVHGQRTMRDQDHWDEISPMPIAWGTQDFHVVEEARKSIPQDQWVKLEKGRKRYEEVKQTRNNLLIL